MKKVAMSLAVLALIGETQAVKLAWGVTSTYDDTFGERFSYSQFAPQAAVQASKEDETDNQTEADAKAAMLAGAAAASVQNDKIRAGQEAQAAVDGQNKKNAAAVAARWAAANASPDGLLHNADGSTEFPGGGVVNGANYGLGQNQSQASVENEDGEVNEAVDIARALAHYNKDISMQQTENNLAAKQRQKAHAERLANAHAHFDGLYHAPDGHVEFVEGGELGGVNEEIILPKPGAPISIGQMMAERNIEAYEHTMDMADLPLDRLNMVQHKARQDDDDTIDEAEKKAGEVGASGQQAVVNEKVRQNDAAAAAAKAQNDANVADAKRRFNPFEGLYHNKDGSRTHFDGQPLNGVNEWVQMEGENMNTNQVRKHHHHHRHHFDNDFLQIRPTTLQEETRKFTNGDYDTGLDKDAIAELKQESMQFQQLQAQKAAAEQVKKQNLAVKVKVQGTYNEFDGLYHGTDGSTFDKDGNKVGGVNIQLS